MLSEYLLIMGIRFDAMLCFNISKEISDARDMKSSRGPHLAQGQQLPNSESRFDERRTEMSRGLFKSLHLEQQIACCIHTLLKSS